MKKTNRGSCREGARAGCGNMGGGRLSLAAVVRHYRANCREWRDAELAYFAGLPTLKNAIRAAAQSEQEDGKRLFHQRRLKKEAIRSATTALLKAANRLQECADFEELFSVVEEATSDIPGIGELFVYDVALRIGAWRKLSPLKVYLHRGTRVGARALGLNASSGSLEMTELPPELQKLPAGEVEDILCIYRDRFPRRSLPRKRMAKRRAQSTL
jgi:hypothetical protein